MKLTKAQIKAHNEAEKLIALDRALKDEEKEFVFENWCEGANHVQSAASAFFTPLALAYDVRVDMPVSGEARDGDTLIDLCAGIGVLAYCSSRMFKRIVCVEINPDYARIGKKLLPEAEWINTSIFDPELEKLGRFKVAVSNPPFGRMVKGEGFKGSYTGAEFEFKCIERARQLARYGVFIIPQNSSGFRYSGARYFEYTKDKSEQFKNQTGIRLEPGAGIDTEYHRGSWKSVSPKVEVVTCDFEGEE